MLGRIPNLPLRKANYALKVLFFSVTINFDNERTVKKGRKETIELSTSNTAEKLSVFEVFLGRIFPHLDWIRKDTPYLAVSSTNAKNADRTPNHTLFTLSKTFRSFKKITTNPLIIYTNIQLKNFTMLSNIICSYSLQ